MAQLSPSLFSKPSCWTGIIYKVFTNFDNSIFNICWTILKLWLSFYSSHTKDGLFISLNPMDHNWNLIPQIVDLLDGYFEIILLPFFLDIELKIWVPRAPLSSLNLIPISCIKNLDSAIISWARCCLLYWQHSNVLTHLLLFTPNPLSMDRPSTYALPLHSFLEISWWTFFSRYSQFHLRELGISLLHSLAGVPHHLQKESRYKMIMDKW